MPDKKDRLKDIQKNISSINITLAKQAVILEEHSRRSTALENIVSPINDKVNMALGALALLGILSTLLGLVIMGKDIIH